MRSRERSPKVLLERVVRKLATQAEKRYPPEYPDMDAGFLAARERFSEFTMTSIERQFSLWKSLEYLDRAGIEGDFLECGVWRGGSSMLAAIALQGLGDRERDLWLFDTFEGMSTPSEHDVSIDGSKMTEVWDQIEGQTSDPVFAYGSLEEVRRNMASTGYPEERLHFVKGKVEETIPGDLPGKIALLRLDTDWYESTRHELEHLWPLLVPGGVLIIDDYGHWAGARRAVDEFFADRVDAPLLNRVDYTARVGVKR
ncbi:MAG: TylF/MycF family methyltransferase [Actinomycetota bacterium]|nr:TylF/MycF family methyltransferase [Actinomycetota bacterium]